MIPFWKENKTKKNKQSKKMEKKGKEKKISSCKIKLSSNTSPAEREM